MSVFGVDVGSLRPWRLSARFNQRLVRERTSRRRMGIIENGAASIKRSNPVRAEHTLCLLFLSLFRRYRQTDAETRRSYLEKTPRSCDVNNTSCAGFRRFARRETFKTESTMIGRRLRNKTNPRRSRRTFFLLVDDKTARNGCESAETSKRTRFAEWRRESVERCDSPPEQFKSARTSPDR